MSGGGTSVQFFGLVEAFVAMEAWTVELGPALQTAAQQFGDIVATETAAIVPVLTGLLASSVVAEADPDGVAVSIGEHPDVPYAGWIEFGGSRGRPSVPEGRYLYPTARAAASEWMALATETANETARTFPWPIPVF